MALMFVDPFGLCDRAFAWLLRVFCYRDLSNMVPSHESRCTVYSKTPVINSRMLELIVSRSFPVGLRVLTLAARPKSQLDKLPLQTVCRRWARDHTLCEGRQAGPRGINC